MDRFQDRYFWGVSLILCDLMSKKSKGAGFNSTTPYRIGEYGDTKAWLKYQNLMQDYEELQKVPLLIIIVNIFFSLFYNSEDLMFCFVIRSLASVCVWFVVLRFVLHEIDLFLVTVRIYVILLLDNGVLFIFFRLWLVFFVCCLVEFLGEVEILTFFF